MMQWDLPTPYTVHTKDLRKQRWLKVSTEVSTNGLTLPFSLLYTRLTYGENLAGRRSKRRPVERVAMWQKHEIYWRPVDQPSQARRPILNLEFGAHATKSTLREKQVRMSKTK